MSRRWTAAAGLPADMSNLMNDNDDRAAQDAQPVSCLEVRRVLGVSSAEAMASFRDHVHECAACREAFEDTRRFESRLKTASQVAVPEGLASRILLAQQFAADDAKRGAAEEQAQGDAPATARTVKHGAARQFRSAWRRARGPLRSTGRAGLATAAAAAVAAVLVATPASPLYQPSLVAAGGSYVAQLQAFAAGEHNTLAAEAIAMVRASPYALDARGPAPVASINEALQAIGMRLDGDLGDVRFAGNCLVRQQLAGHIVMEGEHAPVTVFVMPETAAARSGKFADGEWASVVMPAERGSIAVVGAPGEELNGVIDRIQRLIAEPRAVQVDLRAGIGYYS